MLYKVHLVPCTFIIIAFNIRIVHYNFIVFVLWITGLWIADNTAIQHLLCNICTRLDREMYVHINALLMIQKYV